MDLKKVVEDLIESFLIAGDLAIELRTKGLIKKIKSDNTPVSNGDIEVNKLITKEISKITPEIPIISEESLENKDKSNLKNFWLIDPIDGTHDYINDLEEFTINAGLILNRKPVAGLINVPAKNRMFYTYGKKDAYELTNGKEVKLDCSKKTKKEFVKVVAYSNKIKPEIEKIHNFLGVNEFVRMKSSYKFCVIATGEYDGYVAEPRACEWDIAAGHALLENAGGIITDFEGNEILYGKENFKNPSIILKRSEDLKN